MALWVRSLAANLYHQPDVSSRAPLMQLPWEARVHAAPEQTHRDDRFLEIILLHGERAYVLKGDVDAENAPLDLAGMLRLAHRFTGITYTWGGTSSFGFDCSGYTQMLLRQRGVFMPRDAHLQAVWLGGFSIPFEDLQAGDLLFFAEAEAPITHTGLYLGQGEFIHSTRLGHPGVQVSRLDDPHWRALLVAQRRVP